ncbi:MAG TPA: LLM class flavin-dependent oxidoreductase [Methylomirabilota bacterium]|jgi:alkanesulfonate monooxygenase
MVAGISVYTTCPPSRDATAAGYRAALRDVARWSEDAGCVGALVYADNSLVDPWLVAQVLLDSTERLVPLVAVQPVYMHPYAVAKMVASLAFLHGRRVDLNLVAGGFRRDHEALADRTPHDERYDRLREYGALIAALLGGAAPVTVAGRFYTVTGLVLAPPLSETPPTTFFVAGSSAAGRATACALDAVSVEYPSPGAAAPEAAGPAPRRGVRVGIVTRADHETAWRAARARFPEDRRGRMVHTLAMKISDSSWHRRLSSAEEAVTPPYWLEPFQRAQTFCPYLVGRYDDVGDELRRYVEAGVRTFIVDVPHDADDLHHVARAFEHALAAVPR